MLFVLLLLLLLLLLWFVELVFVGGCWSSLFAVVRDACLWLLAELVELV